jgi:hypothetical protein
MGSGGVTHKRQRDVMLRSWKNVASSQSRNSRECEFKSSLLRKLLSRISVQDGYFTSASLTCNMQFCMQEDTSSLSLDRKPTVIAM